MTENAGLLPFEKMQEVMRQQFFYKFSVYETATPNFDVDVTVKRIEMRMVLINVKDHPDEAMFVPAWYIYYELGLPEFVKERNELDVFMEENREDDLMIMNAIDGGRVQYYPMKEEEGMTAEAMELLEDVQQHVD